MEAQLEVVKTMIGFLALGGLVALVMAFIYKAYAYWTEEHPVATMALWIVSGICMALAAGLGLMGFGFEWD